ncbi:CPBP family glutamic-type intramembrane protease [Flavobacterium gelatinilyticum]|uniref:CPBP family glutamic-type intramembrane protease n=1 Tax=Flavobacterium gelatinilyticum TaxID=3003260 RepID=UPI0024806198|nr:CPBP family glutamic-type intramembrane protease [Flavobacterium gelatinilyticum]
MSLLTPFIWILLLLPFISLAFINTKKANPKYLLYFLLYFLADSYIQIASHHYISLDFMGLKFAWAGKFISLILALTIIFSVTKKERHQIGFTTQTNLRKQLQFGILVFLGFLIFDFVFKMILFPKGAAFDLETFAFQASMPGLTEELAFRGIGFWLLDKAFEPKWNWKGIRFGWGFCIITILFAVAHGAILTPDHQFKFDIITIMYLTVISSLSMGILRKFSGSLIFPVIGHNCINVMNAIIRIL